MAVSSCLTCTGSFPICQSLAFEHYHKFRPKKKDHYHKQFFFFQHLPVSFLFLSPRLFLFFIRVSACLDTRSSRSNLSSGPRMPQLTRLDNFALDLVHRVFHPNLSCGRSNNMLLIRLLFPRSILIENAFSFFILQGYYYIVFNFSLYDSIYATRGCVLFNNISFITYFIF